MCPAECQDPVYPQHVCHCERETVCDPIPVYNPSTAYRGNVTKVKGFANPTDENDPLAIIVSIKYDIAGNVVESGNSSCCQKTTWTYDGTGGAYAYPTEENRGQNGQLTTRATYDKNTGLITTSKDENDQIVSYTYNPINLRITRADYPNGGYTTREYADGATSSVKTKTRIDALKETESWQFADGRGAAFRSRTRTPEGTYLSSDIEFDSMGRAFKSFNPYTAATINDARPANILATEVETYDALGRTLSVKLPDETRVITAYNGMEAIVSDQALKQRRQIRDPLGRIKRVDEPDATGSLGTSAAPLQPTFYEHDGNDNLTKVTQTAGSVTQERVFVYDALSRLVRERQPEMTPTLDQDGNKGPASSNKWTAVYKYNALGLLTDGFDARGVRTEMIYDPLNRPKTVTYSRESGFVTPGVRYTYGDEANNPAPYSRGRLTKIETTPDTNSTVPATVNLFEYDRMGNTVNQTQQVGGYSYALKYSYNLANQLIAEEYPTGKVVRIAVDAMGRTARVFDSKQNYVSGFQYAGTGQLTSMFVGNGTRETYSYDSRRLQLTEQALLKDTQILERYNYSYGVNQTNGTLDTTKNNGQLARIDSYIGGTNSNPTKQWQQQFSYDSLGRLSEAKEFRGDNNNLSYKQKFDYDRFGNQYHKTLSNPTTGQETPLSYQTIEESTNATGDNGDIDKKTNRFTFNQTGTIYDEAGNVAKDPKFRNFDYAYDANNRMIKARVIGTVADSTSVYDALGQRAATKIGNEWRIMVYDIGGRMVCEYTSSAPAGEKSVQYIYGDHQGSTRTITNSAGAIVGRLDYTAFGEEINAGIGARTTAQGYTGQNATRQKYGLTERDEATGLDHTNWRKHENRAGRWTSPDPYQGSMSLSDPQSLNRYTYTNNDPINFIDPSGLNAAAGGGSCYLSWWATAWYQGDTLIGITGFGYSISCSGGGGSGSGGGGSQTGGTPAPLTPKEQKKLQKSIDKVKKKLDKEKCKSFLESRGISLPDLKRTLDTHGRYSAERSTGITVEQAGMINPDEVQRIRSLPPGLSRNIGIAGLNISVSRQLENDELYQGPNVSYKDVGAYAAPWAPDQAVYYDSFSQATVLHEMFHLITRMDHIPIAKQLTGKDYTNDYEASQAINAALKKNGCT